MKMKFRRLLFFLLALLVGYVMVVTIAELPPYGIPQGPSDNIVSQRYIHDALEDTGATNMITAIVVDYRAYDTLFETTVLFTAVMAVLVTLKTGVGKKGDQ